MPSRSQMALALRAELISYSGKMAMKSSSSASAGSVCCNGWQNTGCDGSRVGIYLIQKATSIVLVKYPCKSPRLLLERLYILDLHHKHVPWFSGLDFKGAGQVVNLGQVDVLHVVGTIVVLDLAASPVDAFDLDELAVIDFAVEGDCSISTSNSMGRARWSRDLVIPSGCHLFCRNVSRRSVSFYI